MKPFHSSCEPEYEASHVLSGRAALPQSAAAVWNSILSQMPTFSVQASDIKRWCFVVGFFFKLSFLFVKLISISQLPWSSKYVGKEH